MKNPRLLLLVIFIALSVFPLSAQEEKPVPACSENTFAAFRHLPKLAYECSATLIESDQRILRLPRRRGAIARLITTLRAFTEPAWWDASVNELNACELHGSAGELTEEEKASWRSGDHPFSLFGDEHARLALIADPCYQTGFNGANAFLLYRKDGRVTVTQVLDGYYSRADNSVGVNFAELNGQRLIEIATGNSMPPSLLSYFFVIDRTGRATPKKIFRTGKRLTNQIYSAMLLSEPEGLSLPADASELSIIRNGRLARSFSAYEESDRGNIDANGRRLRRIIYRWNGQSYARLQNRTR